MTKPKMQIPSADNSGNNLEGSDGNKQKSSDATPPEESAKTVQPPAPKAKKALSKEEILNNIRKESLSRVNEDNFMNEEGLGRFDVPKDSIPSGFSVEWKNTHVRGMPVDPSYQLKLQESGWMPAPVELFPSLVPEGYDGATIERDGQILMIRPIELTERAREYERRKASQQMGDKMAQLRATDAGSMDRVVQKLNKSYEKGIPKE